MRRREDGWEDGRQDWGTGGGWQDGPAVGAYGGDYDGYSGGGQEGYGRPGHPGYPGPGPHGRAAAGYPDSEYREQDNFPPPRGEFSPGEAPAAARPRPRTPRPYGRLSIFTLMDDMAAEFDRLAEEAAEGVRISEPDTLVYVIHVVPKAPMQRIVYEIYRDRAAFENHESQPHILRFTEARKSCVLATNIIDLRLKYAKVAALFQGGQAGRDDEQVPEPGDQDSWAGGQRAGGYGGRGAGALPRPQRPSPRALEAGPRQYPGQAPPGTPVRPPWEEEAPGWPASPYPGQRYGG